MHRPNQLVFIVWLITYSHGSLLDFVNVTDHMDEINELGAAFFENMKGTLNISSELNQPNLLNGQVLRVVTVEVNTFNFLFCLLEFELIIDN